MPNLADYMNRDGVALAGLVAGRQLTARELLDAAMARMEAVNPALNAVVQPAVEAGRKRAAAPPSGTLSGVPFLLKDLGCEAIDYPTNLGAGLFRDHRWAYDSELFTRIDRGGLVTFGRTTSPEFGIGPTVEAQVYGRPTANPWNLSHSAGGSSGGAAVAVAAGIVPLAHASDGGGSIRIPASCNGLFGFKPSRALLPKGPMAGEGWGGMSTDGCISRSVRDTAAFLDLVKGADLGAPYRAPPVPDSFLAGLAAPPPKLRIAVSRRAPTGAALHPACIAAIERAARLCADLGHEVEEAEPDIDLPGIMSAWSRVVASGTALTVRNREKLLRRQARRDELEGVARGACTFAATVSGADYVEAIGQLHLAGRRIARFLAGWDVHLTSTLTRPPARLGDFAPTNEDFLDYRVGPKGIVHYSGATPLYNVAGLPAMTVPLHWSEDGLPVGVHFASGAGNDLLLLRLAAALEEAAPWNRRRPPEQD